MNDFIAFTLPRLIVSIAIIAGMGYLFILSARTLMKPVSFTRRYICLLSCVCLTGGFGGTIHSFLIFTGLV